MVVRILFVEQMSRKGQMRHSDVGFSRRKIGTKALRRLPCSSDCNDNQLSKTVADKINRAFKEGGTKQQWMLPKQQYRGST